MCAPLTLQLIWFAHPSNYISWPQFCPFHSSSDPEPSDRHGRTAVSTCQLVIVDDIANSIGLFSLVSVSRSSAEAPSNLQLSKAFDSIEVIGLDGKRRPVTDLWKDRKVVVAWARHFGLVS